MTSATFRCADGARDRHDPPLGTAPVAPSFVLIEHPGPWRFDALTGAGWSAEVVTALTAAVRASRSRLLLMRRPGRRPDADRRVWAIVRVGAGTTWGTWREEGELLAVPTALTEPWTPGSDASEKALAPEPLLLVCTHGLHDACCAVRGRPVATALARHWPAATWECSHVGGDRFAANLVVLPDGTYYGDLDADTAVEVIAGHLRGRLDPVRLRGSVRWPPVAQVAVGEVHRRLGPYGAEDVRAERWTAQGPGHWLVEVSGPDGRRWAAEVAGERRAAARLTCSATQATSATTYRVVALTESV